MSNQKTARDAAGKTKYAIFSIVLSITGIIIDAILRHPVIDTFSVGFILTFIAFLLSLSSVREEGRNVAAKLAFWLGIGGMWVSACLSLL